MSLQWIIAAGFLYFEIGLVLLFVLPILSPRGWQKVFRSRVFDVVRNQAQFYFWILVFVLTLLDVDAIREMRKYSSVDSSIIPNDQTDTKNQMRLFRAQRNFYISSFALFLAFVIYRLAGLISSLATTQAQNEATMRQAESATTAARTLLNQNQDNLNNSGQNAANEAHEKVVADLKKEVASLQEKLEKEKKDAQALKSQAQATNKEYDRLTAEYAKLQKQVTAAGAGGDKKAD